MPTTYYLAESTIAGQIGAATRRRMFDGDRLLDRRARAVRRRHAAPKELTDGLARRSRPPCRPRRRRSTADNDATVLQPLLDRPARRARAPRAAARAWPIDDSGRFEIDFRLRRRSANSSRRFSLANGVRIEALADDGVVVPGQPVRVNVIVANRGAADVTVKQVSFERLRGDRVRAP